jgi:hypothetical protein
MPFSLTEIELKQALQESGCPLCWIGRNAAERYIRHLLWESVNDGETRRHFLESLGYCPEHTRMLASRETEEYGDSLGVNILYENLVGVVAGRLETLDLPKELGSRERKLFSDKSRKQTGNLVPASACRVCQMADSSTQYALKTLLEELDSAPGDWQPRYAASGGLCLAHLRQCMNAADHSPAPASFLREDALSRLKRWQEGLQGYVRKHSWDLRDVPLTENERQAWREVLAFFTGQPLSSFEGLEDRRSR